MSKESLFIRACRGEQVERTPIWVMRQAGRYLPEYNEVRGKTTFLGLCKTPELAAQVTMQPIERFGLDAAIIFSDILIPVEAMGARLVFDEGPSLPEPVRDASAVDRLVVPDPISTMPFVLEAIRTFRSEMPDTPLIGFAGAPFTLAAYLIEGGGSQSYHQAKRFMYEAPKTVRALLHKLALTVAAHLSAQIDAGAQAVQIFDSWAGYLSPSDYRDFALPFTIQVIEAVAPKGVPIIVFAKGVHACLSELAMSGAHVLGVDWTMPLNVAGQLTEGRVVLQGNLDPCVLLGPKARIEREVQRILNEAKGLRGHIFNLGHGILKWTDPEHLGFLVDSVKRNGVVRVPKDL
ncbi:MAG: uroporphyrinogen decarboxylase [Deltaproteobacteria bacterium]|nr:uroporphyrinogen decarboxylase [Deltaproteobacteria bacterium]